MKNTIYSFSFIIMLALLGFSSCYRDLGNYEYEQLNEISVDLPDTIQIQQGAVLSRTPTLTFTGLNDETNLSFQWVVSIPTSSDTTDIVLSTDRNIEEVIDYPTGSSYPLNFKVTDNSTGVTYRKQMILTVQTEYQPGYFVLERNSARGDISFINTRNGKVFHHLFSEMNPEIVLPTTVKDIYSIDINGYTVNYGTPIKYGPRNLSVLAYEGGGYVYDYRSAKSVAPWEELFYAPQPVVNPGCLFMDSSPNLMAINDGKLHRMFQGNGQTLFGDPFTSPDRKDYELAPFIVDAYQYILVFDKLNNRFMTESYRNLMLDTIGGTKIPEIDPNNVSRDYTLIYLGVGGMMKTMAVALFKHTDGSCYLAKFNRFEIKSFKRVEESPGILASKGYLVPMNREQVYYMHENKIYLLNIAANSSRVIYQFGGEQDVNQEVPTSFMLSTNGRELTVATHDGAEGAVYCFDLDGTGGIAGGTFKSRYDGFDEIVKLVFKP